MKKYILPVILWGSFLAAIPMFVIARNDNVMADVFNWQSIFFLSVSFSLTIISYFISVSSLIASAFESNASFAAKINP